MTMRKSFLAGLSLAAALWASTALARENHALLVGASTYPNLAQAFWLKGPANDVALVRGYLENAAPVPFAAENITVLADGVDGAEAPTLAAIRAAFDALEAKVQPGDFIYLHFSGHGSQSPARDPETELDGLDEIFLPVDIGPWNDTVGNVQNALVDDEIGQMLDRLRARGADIWVVFDACHSGTATRAAPGGDDDLRARQLPAAALGVPEDAVTEAASRALPPPDDPRAPADSPVALPEGAGKLVAFFAAQTNETTPEKNLPRGKPGRMPLGVFTHTLFETLAEYPGATYRQIGQEVLRKYAVKNLARSTPLFEGDLDAVVFSADPAPRVAQWPASREGAGFVVPAGELHGLAEGSVLAIMASAADPTDAALGYMRVTSVTPFSATAEPVAHADRDVPAEIPRGIQLRKTAADLDFSMTIALPEGDGPAAAAMRDAAAVIAEDGMLGSRVRFVAPGDPDADLRLGILPDSPRPDAIWVLPQTGMVDDAALATTPSVSTGDKDVAELATVMADTLGRMTRAINLMKLGAGIDGGGALDVEVDLLTRPAGARGLEPLQTGGVPRLIPDDEVHLDATNHTDGPVDLNVLYIGSDYSITHMFAGRLQPGDRLRQGLLRITDTAFGRDRVVLVLSPAEPRTAVEDLSFLSQDALEVTRAARGGSLLGAAMREAGFGETTRGAVPLGATGPAAPAPAILQFDLDTIPAD
jgi:hypothetical protein